MNYSRKQTQDFRSNDIKSLNRQLGRAQSMGHVIRTSAIYDTQRDCNGLEFFLDVKIVPQQIRKIVNHIVSEYDFDAYYYTKTHSVKVWYRTAK